MITGTAPIKCFLTILGTAILVLSAGSLAPYLALLVMAGLAGCFFYEASQPT